MSDNDGPLHDPIIDTLEESDEASPRQEEEQHSDHAHMGSFNGDSLPTTGSPFKKGYGAGSLGEASVDSLVDEPLPIESVHLSPFRIETIHNSPLSGRQKDPHTFSVSVPDSLPVHVMELDSPEHYGDKMDEPYEESEFSVEKVPPAMKVSEDESFLIGGATKSFPVEASGESSPIQDSLASILGPTQEDQKQKSDPSLDEDEEQSQSSPKVTEMDTQPTTILLKDFLSNERFSKLWETDKIGLGTFDSMDISSQADMFESQVETSPHTSSKVPSHQTDENEDSQIPSHQLSSSEFSKDLSKGTESCKDIDKDTTVDDGLAPPSDVHGHSQTSPLQSVGTKRILSSAESSSPVKRKRDNLEEISSDRKIIKKDRKEIELEGEGGSGRKQVGGWVPLREKPEEADSDIEILDSESFSSANQSVEVVFDKNSVTCDTTETLESQDLKLLLTGATQSEEDERDVVHQGVEKELPSSQSPSLLSLPDSVSLTCNEHVSSSFLEENPSSGRGENTLQPTQVELLCADREAASTQHTSQPNIKPLLNLPLVQGKVTSNSCNESTNNISSSNNNNNSSSSGSCNGNVISIEHEEIRNRVESTVECTESQKSIDPSGSSEVQSSAPVVSYPRFHTPSQIGEGSHEGVEEEEESVFVKAVNAAEKKKEEARQLEMEKAKTKSNFDYSSPLSFEEASSKHSPYEAVSSGDSNNSTPLCAIKPTRYSQSTPISSQLTGEPSKWLFSNISQEHATNSSDNSKNNSHKSNVRVGDSDDEDEQTKVKDSDTCNVKNPKPKISSSTPNVSGRSNISPDSSKDEPISEITKSGGSINSTVDLTSHNSNHVQSKTDTLEIESGDIHSPQDLINSGWINLGERKFTLPIFECWENPTTKERVFSIVGADEVIKENTPFSVVVRYASLSKSNSRESRISDVSSFSKSTTSSGYLADRSASLSNPEAGGKLESTRLSMGSVCVISPPEPSSHSIIKSTSDSGAKKDDDLFVYPLPKLFPPQRESVVSKSSMPVATDKAGIERVYEINVNETSSSDSERIRIPRGRGRPRGRARGRGRGRGVEKLTIPPSITEEVKLGVSQSDALSEKDDEYGDRFLYLLPEFLQQKLKNSQIPLTEDEEEIFILQKNQVAEKDQKDQFDQVCSKVRVAEVKPGLLVFARYFDNNYYSAIIKKPAKEDRWKIQYNLDELENDVREMYILPTEILPKGTACYVMHPKQNYSDPGIVRSHIYQDGVLIHVIEIQRGLILKATHSHIILKTEVAEALNKSRYNFHSMIASPGVEVSLDNIVVGKRRRDTSSSSPQKQLQAKMAPPPHPRKADYTLDTTDEGSTSKKQESVKTKRIPTAFTDTSLSESELYYSALEGTPKSSRKKVKKSPASLKTPRSKTSKKQLLKQLVEEPTDTIEEHVRSASPLPLEKIDEPLKHSSKKSKGTPASKTSRKKIPEEAQKVSSKSKESLLNPVVELIQLQEVKSSPKSVTKKRGRRPGNATKNPRKILKLEEGKEPEDGEDVTEEIDPSLGPLPPPDCQLFKGYTILITHAINVQNATNESEEKSPLPMKKDYLKKQIIGGGGVVVESFQEAYHELHQFLQSKKSSSKEDINNKDGKKNRSITTLPASESPSRVLCVSNGCCRTAKYIQCLTVGIPLVNMEWVTLSITMNQCLNWSNYLLPAGYSLMTGCNIEQIFGNEFKDISINVGKVTEVVKDDKVYLASSSNPEFGELWHHLLTVAQAAVFKMPVKGGNLQRLIERKTDFVIADHTIPEQELKRAQELNKPVVSSEWFIQSLITGFKLPFDAQPQFKFDYKASSSIPSGSRDNNSEEDADSDR